MIVTVIRAILFDFDGTLARFRGDMNAISRDLFQKLSVTNVPEGWPQVFRKYEYAPGHVTLASALIATLKEFGIEPAHDPHEVAAEFIERYAAQIKPLPDALEMLRYFSHLPKAILTNGPCDVQRHAIRASGLEGYFDAILVSGDADVGFAKPHPRMFQLACERLQVAPNEALMIGDRLELDVEGALGVGTHAIHRPEK
jgi:putative hydrolase of the HAD superfamily